MFRAALLATLGLFLVSPALAQDNLITFGDFEDLAAGTQSGIFSPGFAQGPAGTTYTIDGAVAHTGTQSLRVDYPGGATNFYDVQAVGTDVPVTPGEEYTFSVWARTGGADGAGQFAYGVLTPSYTPVVEGVTVSYGTAITGDWQEFTFTFTVPSDATYSTVNVVTQYGFAGNENEPVYIDDLSLTHNAEEPPPVGEDGLYQAPLAGANERPTPVETDASGFAYVEVDGTTVTVTGWFSELSAAYAASHIHGGAADETGSPVLTLTASANEGDTAGRWHAVDNTFTVRQSFADSIKSGLAYLNVHSTAYAAGEIRGQVAPAVVAADLIITGAIDGPLSGGVPKAVELYALNDIPDLSVYGLAVASNGNPSPGAPSIALPSGSAEAGDYLYVASEVDGFTAFFGFAPDTTGSVFINGDDAVELYLNRTLVVDVFGEVGVDGTGQPWEHTDGWAYRNNQTGPDGATFVLDNWTFSGLDALDGATTNATATTPFPVGTYSDTGGPVAEPVPFAFGFESLDGIGSWKNTTSEPGLTLSLSDDAVEGDSSLQVAYDFVADQSWGGSVDISYAPEGGFVDLSSADGIRFWYKTVEPVSNATEVSFAVKLVDASAEAGVDHYEARVPAVITNTSGEWQELEIPFSSFAIPSWVTPQDETFDLDAISAWEMQVVVGTPGVGNTYAGTVLLDGLDLYTAPLPVMDIALARDAALGETIRVVGTVTRSAGDFTYLQDASGGLTVRQTSGAFADAVASGGIAPGTVIDLTGVISEYNGLLQINAGDLESFEITGTTDVPEAQAVTLAELAANGEAYEAELVTVRAVTFSETGTFAERTTYQVTDESDDSNTVTLRVPNAGDTTVDGEVIPAQANVTAVVGQFSSSDPAAGYQLLVIDAGDIVNSVDAEDGAAAGLAVDVANPIQGATTVRFTLDAPGAARLALYDMLGRQVAVVAEGEMATGTQTARLDAGTLSTGVYVLRLEAESGAVSRTVTVVR